jgi:branched-chain amino acid transport system substrate-binding protein
MFRNHTERAKRTDRTGAVVRARSIRALVVAVLAGLLAGPLAEDVAADEAGRASARMPVQANVAVFAPLSGDQAARGREVVAGVELALADLAAATDPSRSLEPLRLEVLDDGCDAEKAERHATALRTARLPELVVAPVCDGAALAAARVLASAGVPVISPGARHPRLTVGRASGSILRLAGREDRQGRETARVLATLARAARIALVHDRTRYGSAFIGEVDEGAAALGLNVVARATLVAGALHYDALVTRLVAADAEFVLFGGFPAEASVLLRSLREAGSGARLFGPVTLADPSFAALAGNSAEGVSVMLPVGPPPTKEGHRLAQRLAARTGITTEHLTGDGHRAHAAVQAWWQARRRSDETRGEDVLAILARDAFDTVLGPLRFDPAGDAMLASYELAVWRAGHLQRGSAAASARAVQHFPEPPVPVDPIGEADRR